MSARDQVTSLLAKGDIPGARVAFDAIPLDEVGASVELKALHHELADAEEAMQLGVSVYPFSVPMEERWRAPRLVPMVTAGGARLVLWFPGSVQKVESNGEIVIAVVVPMVGTQDRRVIARRLTPNEWQRLGWCPASESVGQFFEMGTYTDGTVLFAPCPS